MKNLPITIVLTALIGLSYSKAQDAPSKKELIHHFGFTQDSILTPSEKIIFYQYQKGKGEKDKLVVYLQGSDPSPQFSYRIRENKVEKFCWLPADFKNLPEDYLYVVVEKIGFEGLINEDNIPKPEIYRQKNSLNNRVFRTNNVINKLCSEHSFNKVIVYGHSEGAPVAAKLGTVNEKITHLGFWAGNALPDFYDFVLEVRKQFYKGELSAKKSQKQIDDIINSFVEEIAQDSLNTDDEGYTNKRWWSYSEPPINHLLKIDIPIFVQVATDDGSAPIESTYLIPLEFARLGKSNLTYKVCVGCDHSFNYRKDKGKVVRNWDSIFKDFMAWTDE